MNSMFRSLGLFNYRVWFVGGIVSNIGGWMQATAQDWVVLTELTHNDATAMGVTMSLQFGPPLLLVGITGWVADHFDRRKLLMLTQSTLGVLAIIVGTMLLTGTMTLPLMWMFAGFFGTVNAFDAPARQAFVSDVVSQENAANAVALNSASFNMARLIGPAVGGVMIVLVGTGWLFLINAATFGVMLVALSIIRAAELVPRSHATNATRIADGFRYIARRPDLLVLFIMVFLIGAFGMNFSIFASTMALSFGKDASGYGLLTSILAIGSLSGALMAARRARARMRVVIIAAGGFGLALLLSSLMPEYLLYGASLVLVGYTTVSMLTTANGYVQTTTEPALVGRVLALYTAVLMGSTPVGSPVAGWVANTFGPRAAIQLGAVAGLLAFAVGAVWMARSGRLHRHESRSFLLSIDETRPLRVIEPVPEEFSDELAASTAPITLPKLPAKPGAAGTRRLRLPWRRPAARDRPGASDR